MEQQPTPQYESKKLAQCFLTKWGTEIHIPDSIFSLLKPLGNNIVAVIPGDSKKISFFLTNSNRILFVKLLLDKSSLNESFFSSLRQTLRDLKMDNLFSTGVCFKDEICVWEGVFEFDREDHFQEIQVKFSHVLHVKQARFEKIELPSDVPKKK